MTISPMSRAHATYRISPARAWKSGFSSRWVIVQGRKNLRWKTFETTLDIGMLRDHIARLPDFAEFDVLEKAFAHAIGFEGKYRALEFFLNWPRLDLAAKVVVDRRAEW
jgi:hypothetical protein